MKQPITYVLPLRWTYPGPIDRLAAYLECLSTKVDEIWVVDGSPSESFGEHRSSLPEGVHHVRPDGGARGVNGKVDGVTTGIRLSRNEFVVIADDDVRYDGERLARIGALLENADLVRPQNYFGLWPWHAVWDGPRSLINRVVTGDPEFPSGDFPGTLGIRRSVFLRIGGYDPDALFENLELMRTVLAGRGRVATPLDLFVEREPPTSRHFLSQRVRQAYDDHAMPFRAATFLFLIPAAVALPGAKRIAFMATVAGASVGLAEIGRRRAGAARHFPGIASLCAPAWIAERSVCAWLALGAMALGGVRYGNSRVSLAANSTASLRRRLSGGRKAQAGRAAERVTSRSS